MPKSAQRLFVCLFVVATSDCRVVAASRVSVSIEVGNDGMRGWRIYRISRWIVGVANVQAVRQRQLGGWNATLAAKSATKVGGSECV
jgi:hypothetical protein